MRPKMKEDFEIIWKRIKDYQGKQFFKSRGGSFTYTIGDDDSFNPSIPETFPQASNKENVKRAYEQWPVKGPSFFSKDIFAASYVWGVLNDSRIINKEI